MVSGDSEALLSVGLLSSVLVGESWACAGEVEGHEGGKPHRPDQSKASIPWTLLQVDGTAMRATVPRPKLAFHP